MRLKDIHVKRCQFSDNTPVDWMLLLIYECRTCQELHLGSVTKDRAVFLRTEIARMLAGQEVEKVSYSDGHLVFNKKFEVRVI